MPSSLTALSGFVRVPPPNGKAPSSLAWFRSPRGELYAASYSMPRLGFLFTPLSDVRRTVFVSDVVMQRFRTPARFEDYLGRVVRAWNRLGL